ncbi:MAG TPA: ABC transporter ATP-binding protein [Acetobacteraceae bacterium]|nr:ABC transporter ATP-binding protein [Acetobacteraceae bacterium]
MSTALVLDRVGKRFGTQQAVADMSLSITPGEMVVLLGPSGCGKTTSLRMIAGFLQPTSGDIRLDGRSILPLAAHQREMGIVFQSYALFPHLSVARNVAFGLEMRRMDRPAIDARVAEMLQMVKLETFASRLPRHLSGGQQQRVALARALAIHPRLLLLDEPLSNLDAALRLEMAREIRLLQRERGITTVMVTHDQTEAMALADRLVVMRDGHVQQIGRPEDLYERPANPFVAGFIGGSNILTGQHESGRLVLAGGGIVVLTRNAGIGLATLAIRPESIRLAPAGTAGCIEGEVELCTYLGTAIEHVVRLDPEAAVVVRGPGLGADAARRYDPGTRVALSWTQADERLFNAEGRPLPMMEPNEIKQGEKEWTS